MQNQKSIFYDSKKFIIREKGNNEVYSQNDISENSNLINDNKSVLKSLLKDYGFTNKRVEKPNNSEKMKDRLRNLGYY